MFIHSCLKRQSAALRKLDWSERGVLDEVVNQGDCGSCFTVATTRIYASSSVVFFNFHSLDDVSVSSVAVLTHKLGGATRWRSFCGAPSLHLNSIAQLYILILIFIIIMVVGLEVILRINRSTSVREMLAVLFSMADEIQR